MNRYGRMALEHNRRFHPQEFEQIPDPEAFFAGAGKQIEADVARVRDQILGARQSNENIEHYRQRSYQALRTAEELVLADHYLLRSPADSEDRDPQATSSSQTSAELGQAIQEAHDILTTPEQ
jgi:hypothetical protein